MKNSEFNGMFPNDEPDMVPYHTICTACKISRICGCSIGNTMVQNPKKHTIISTDKTNLDIKKFSSTEFSEFFYPNKKHGNKKHEDIIEENEHIFILKSLIEIIKFDHPGFDPNGLIGKAEKWYNNLINNKK